MTYSKKVTHSEKWWATAPPYVIRCNGHYKTTGLPCRREAASGTTVCREHGALIPVVQAAAADRIRSSVDDIVKLLHQMMTDPSIDPRERIKIMLDQLDRGGLGATSKHLVDVGEDTVDSLFRSILSKPGALVDVTAVQVPALPHRDPAQDAIDTAEDGYTVAELFGRETGRDDVVDAELVPDEDLIGVSTTPPKHIRDDLARLGLL